MCPGDDGPDPKFDASDEVAEDTQPDGLAARRRRLAGAEHMPDVAVELLRTEHTAFGERLSNLEGRMTTMVDRVIDLMISDQDDHEVLVAVRKELAETRAELKRLLLWIRENRGP